MQWIKIKKTICVSMYFNTLIILIVFLYLLSSFIYLITPSRLEPQILYYYTYLEESSGFVPEIRNMPKTKKGRQEIFSLKLFHKNNIEALIYELMLGPQNIYAVPFATRYFMLDKVLFSSKQKEVYIQLIVKDESDDLITKDILEKTRKWFEKNIRKYFDIDNVVVIIKKQ